MQTKVVVSIFCCYFSSTSRLFLRTRQTSYLTKGEKNLRTQIIWLNLKFQQTKDRIQLYRFMFVNELPQ